mmetsp:Transcript_55189/g.124295  ORF Transcript_55189/g.124295 Transcript_55189/m.124295 type:complete len:208 (-) Transcript_55189:1129-1752(-)
MLEQLQHTLLPQAELQLIRHPAELGHAEQPVPVRVEAVEEVRAVRSVVAMMDEVAPHAPDKEDSVPVLPHLAEAGTQDANGDRHVECAGDHENSDCSAPQLGLGSQVAVPHGRHGDYREPHGLFQRGYVLAVLDAEENGGKEQHQEEVDEEQHGKGLKGEVKGLREQLAGLEAPQGLQQPQHGHVAQEYDTVDVPAPVILPELRRQP